MIDRLYYVLLYVTLRIFVNWIAETDVRARLQCGGYLSRNVNIPSKVIVLVPLGGKGTGEPGLLEGGAAVWVGIIAVSS